MPTMQVCRVDGYRVMPWKNGGGATTEIATAPEGASLDGFDWRLSMARIEVDGPFSVFAGIDRTLTLLDGPRVELQVEGRPVTLTPTYPTLRFAGEDRVSAAVPDGPITDFNVMTRRTRCRHSFRSLEMTRRSGVSCGPGMTVLFLAQGPVLVCRADSGAEAVLYRRDCLILEPGDPSAWQIEAAAPAVMFQIDIA